MNLSLLAKSSKSLFRLFFVIIFFLFSFEISFADGGTVTYVDSNGQNPRSSPAYTGGYTIETFTTSGTFTVPAGVSSAEVLIVAGGGGGTVYYSAGYTGGGGAGGLLHGTLTGLSGSYDVTVGSGGASANGGNSSFGSHTALGGGYATGLYQGGAASGGSGGGSCCASSYSGSAGAAATQGNSSPLTGYGNAGGAGHAIDGVGAWGGGGGGAGGAGGAASYPAGAGSGGAGRAYNISGATTTYAAGGYTGSGAGAANTGNGGGAGQNGGSGIVIVKYLSIDPNLPTIASATSTYITTTTAVLGATIESIGGSSITDRGICYGVSASSTTCTSEGSVGTGSYSLQIFGLATSTTYYYYAYAVNSYGTSTTVGAYFTTEGLTNSLMFDSASSQYLSRTFSTPTDNKKWTWSGWIKRSSLVADGDEIFNAGQSGSNDGYLRFNSSNGITFGTYTGGGTDYGISTSAVFRDPSIWYHITVVYDSANANAADRGIIYVNGVRQTVSNAANGIWPQNFSSSPFNTAVSHSLMSDYQRTSGLFNDGYLSDVNFVDGQALTPSYFGKSDSNTGNWTPKAYQGTYGVNGFHLNFSSSTALGYDTAPLDTVHTATNTWTTNGGIASSTNQVIDTPLNNFAVLNRLNEYGTLGSMGLSKGSLQSNPGGASVNKGWTSTFASPGSGLWYAEFKFTSTLADNNGGVGIMRSTDNTAPGESADTVRWGDWGAIRQNSGSTSYGNSLATNDIVMVAYDATNGKVWFGKNGSWFDSGNPSAGTNPSATGITSSGFFTAYHYNNSATSIANFGQKTFAYTPPTGFKSLSTANLPTPTILKPNQHFDTKIYTGTGAGQIISGLNFQPDLVWLKGRTGARVHGLWDSARGSSKYLVSNNTDAETTDTSNGLQSFDSNGFSIGSTGTWNTSAENFVSWNWKGGNATTINTSGTITSTISANPTAGFSVVTYTGNGSASTIGHGLGQVPTMIIVKARGNISTGWATWHKSLTSASYQVWLNLTSAQYTPADWNATAPTSTVFSVGAQNEVNQSTVPYVAYTFSEVPGYSKFGSYTGNGSTDGPFVYTGFKPKYVMVKKISDTGDWVVLDTTRDTYNEMTNYLVPNSSGAESSGQKMDMVSNGFKVRVGVSTAMNDSGGTYIYAAFAESILQPTIPPLPALSSPTATGTTEVTAVLGGTVDSVGSTNVTARGVCYGSAPAPTTNCTAGTGTTTGIFTVNITSLATSTTYYYRAYATNSYGTAYSSDSTFTTEGLTNSLMFDSSQSQYLSRTFSTPTDNKKWTWSGWVKRSKLSSGYPALFAFPGTTDELIFYTNDLLQYYNNAAVSSNLLSNQMFRDSATFVHVTLAVDTTQSTASDRVKIYINGSQMTSLSQTSYPSLNYSQGFNSAGLHQIGKATGAHYFDGYLSDIYFVDGQQLTPTNFGKTDGTTGNWIPKKYTGTYGNNGFHLQFNNAGLLGADTSGNGNHWSLNGGITQANNQVTDTPLNNFTTWNGLLKPTTGSPTYSAGNLKWSNTSSDTEVPVYANVPTTGKWYAEFKCTTIVAGCTFFMHDFYKESTGRPYWNYTGPGSHSNQKPAYYMNGNIYHSGGTLAATSFTSNDVISIAYDADTGKVWFAKNGAWQNSGNPSAGTGQVDTLTVGDDVAMGAMGYQSTVVVANFGQRGFSYTPPTGFKALSSANLPVPTILKPNRHFDAVTYSGSNSTQSITSLSFKPDFVWIKSRSTADSHALFDAVRTSSNGSLSPNTSGAEDTTGRFTSFDSYGFTLPSGGWGMTNASGQNFVAWNWKGGNSTTTNTSGTITSTVSANPTAGFSVVTYTGNATAGQTIGHGLGAEPTFMIIKSRGSQVWNVYHKAVGATNNTILQIDSSSGLNTGSNITISASSSTFGVGSAAQVNGNGVPFVAYVFKDIEGYSKFGKYMGNGSTDGTFVYTGFKPRYVMIKRAEAANWVVFDTLRNGYNKDPDGNATIYPGLSNAEVSNYNTIDILSNGFKMRNSSAGYNTNDSGGLFAYAAFAETTMIPTIPSLPSVSSPTATSTTETTVTLGGTVDSLGGNGSITARGTCFATTRNPTINCLPEGATTTGIFTQTRTGLATSTTYYYRAYATNSYGTAYSSDSTFTTEGLTSSLILDSSQSQYLSRTFSTPTDGKKYTFSTWVKRSKLGYEWDMFTSGSGAGTDSIYFSSSDDAIIIRDASSGLLKRTAQVFRDPSKWYHIVLAVDTTQSTADNRNRLYIDGVENTSWVTNTTNSTQDAANNFNSAQIHRLGAYASGGYGEGYQSDTNFVDGQQLTPSSFGQADSNTGNWIPKSYTGSYGTNGFRLKFNNANSLGQDTSGNNNNWSLNGGITQANNQVTDTPLNNFATLNPIDGNSWSGNAITSTFSKASTKATHPNAGTYTITSATYAVKSGKWYGEFTVNSLGSELYVGIASPYASYTGKRRMYSSSGSKNNESSTTAFSSSYTTNDVIGVAMDLDNGNLEFFKNGSSVGVAYTDLISSIPQNGWTFATFGYNGASVTFNAGQKTFSYSIPLGYKALSTANLPVPNILKPNQHFDTVTYTGNSSSKSISTLNFKPDLVWIKGRSYGSSNHIWNDAVRGPNKTIFSNQSLAEYTDRGVESFDTNGFSMSGTEGGDANADTQTYVAWNWKGGNATTTNTSGSITSTVSANPTAGFSIINYTGTGSNGTVGHGLGSIPNFIIFKQRSGGASSGVQDWGTYHSSIGPTGAVRLSTNNANVTNSTYFNNATPTATVINLGSFQNYNELNGNFITYAFTEVSGYSKFGSYTGNGSADGPFIYTGFKPRWIMIKRTNTLNEWAIIDTARNTYNPLTTQLYANQSIQDTTWSSIDSLSNGFKLRSNNGESNGASDSYIYAAFAESIMIPTATPISTTTIMLSNVTLTPGDAQVNIGYYVPENPNFSEVVVLRSSSGQVTDTPVDGTSYSAGNTIGSATVACVDSSIASSTFDSCTSSSLTNNTTYYFKVFTKNSDNIYTAIPLADNSSTPGVSSVDLSLSAYRIREDNGDEFSATYTNPENTPITNNFIVGDKKRIRFVVSNQTTSLTSKRYQIEYSITPCTSWTVLPKATESTNQHFRIEQSNFLNDGSATTHSSGLSVPGGKTFTPGKIQSFNNLTDPITLRSNEYTEIEYSIRSTPHITPNTEYCFRLTGSGDSAGFTYTNIPQFTSKISAFRPQSGGGGGSRYIAPIVGQAITAAVEESATTTAPVVSGGGQSGGGIVATNTEQIATTTAPQQSTSTNTKVKDSGGDSGNLQIKNEFALIKDTTNFLSLFIKELANYQLKSTAINAYAYQECNLKGLIFIKTGECEHLDMYGDNKSKLNLNILWSIFNKIEEIGK